MKINAQIVDDDDNFCKLLYFSLGKNCPNVQIVNISYSVSQAKSYLNGNNVDVVFLDILMPGENGFLLLPLLHERGISFIFVTADDKYALKAIQSSAADYLLKPVNDDKLVDAVSKVSAWKMLLDIKNKYEAKSEKSFNSLMANLPVDQITLSLGKQRRSIDLDSIMYISADKYYSIFHLQNGEKVVTQKYLKQCEKMLTTLFFRIHKSTIINMQHVAHYSDKEELIVTLRNDTEHVVSRRLRAPFLKKITKN